jgi:hypothetical protein
MPRNGRMCPTDGEVCDYGAGITCTCTGGNWDCTVGGFDGGFMFDGGFTRDGGGRRGDGG